MASENDDKHTTSEWLTTSQAGRLLGLTSTTICRMCNDGRLKHIRPAGTQRRIHRSVIEAHLVHATGTHSSAPTLAPTPTPMPPESQLNVRKRPAVMDWIRQEAAKHKP